MRAPRPLLLLIVLGLASLFLLAAAGPLPQTPNPFLFPAGFKVALLPGANPIRLHTLSNLLTPAECATLVLAAEGKWARSKVRSGHTTYRRTSSSVDLMQLWRESVPGSPAHRAATAFLTRVAAITGTSIEHIDKSELLRYEPGDSFFPHCDEYLVDPLLTNPRRYSLFTYLNSLTDEDDTGGATHFTQLQWTFRPRVGSGLWWENCPSRYAYHALSEHQGLPPLRQTKFAINTQINFDATPFNATDPKPTKAAHADPPPSGFDPGFLFS